MKYIASIRPISTQRVSADSTFEDLGNQPHSELGRFVAWLVGSDRDVDALSPDELANLFAEYAAERKAGKIKDVAATASWRPVGGREPANRHERVMASIPGEMSFSRRHALATKLCEAGLR
jgi:hypothetical protein